MAGRSLTPAEIYEQVTGGQGAESLGETRKTAEDLSQRLVERIDEIAALAEKVRAGWHGVTAEESASATAPLMAASAAISANLGFARTAADGQVSAFHAVKNTVKPIGDRPEISMQDVYDLLHGKPGYFGKLHQWQADAQHNIDAYTGYHSATGTNSDRIPAHYAELSDTGASIGLASTSTPRKPVEAPGGPGGEPPDGRGPRAVEPPPGVAGPAAGPAGPVPKRREPVPATRGDRPSTHAGRRGPDPTGSGSPATPSEAAKQSDATHTSSYRPSPIALPPGYQFGPSGQSINPLATEFDPVPGSGYDFSSPGGNPNGGQGSGNRVGARTPGEPAPARGGQAGTPGAAAKNGNLVGNGIPGKSKEKDKERTAPPYLRETDPDVFGGSDGKPTPPVIGDRPVR
ncbi:hypothetical protein L3Q65_29580 [Amycolatopsis sp. FU40]|uniref:hypothetical protein n=1 Tax=Amycolatopsis sp. FU40 TaxID=2914159 RepID=UPI001F3FB52D|nr:hypothetical protein [Amycolatopsis sp. FU40]UKD52061.1 hypothetical protein L3Q65_29580 [Amycolatopsis sp. FU40]